MNFFEKLKSAIKKIKVKLIVSAILVIAIIVWGIAPFSVSVFDGIATKGEFESFNWKVFLEELGKYITSPLEAVKLCFTETYFHAFWYVTKMFLGFYSLFVLVGIARALPKHEFEDIENGSSDWSENGEQYKVLNKNKGIVLAEKNYLPVDKRGNVNVLVVRRFWCW